MVFVKKHIDVHACCCHFKAVKCLFSSCDV